MAQGRAVIGMSKDVPTLADAMIAMAFNKSIIPFGTGDRLSKNQIEYRRHLLSVGSARKFVLDDAMSKFVFDIERGLWPKGSLRKRIFGVENARMLSRLPHALTFIEMSYWAFLTHAKETGCKIVGPDGKPNDRFERGDTPTKVGWILRQHPRFDNVVISTEVRSSVLMPNAALVHPVSMVWTVDNNRLPIEIIQLYDDDGSDQSWILTMMDGYKTDKAGWTLTFGDELSMDMVESLGPYERKPSMTATALWGLLSTINDLPVVIEHVEPSRGFMARGNYRKFLKHSVVRLTVPETRWRKLVTKVASLIKRRAHQVRGHWRNDWRHPLTAACEHVYNGQMVCEKCRGRKLWIDEHQRGDASLGFVTHDYAVSKSSGYPQTP